MHGRLVVRKVFSGWFFCIMNMVAYKLPIFSPGIALERQSKPPWIRTVRVHVKKATYYYYRAEIG